MSRRKQALPARRTDLTEEVVGEQETEALTDGQIGDIQEADMDHKDRPVSVRETRSSTSSSGQSVASAHSKSPKTKGVGLRGSPVKGERSGLRRTQRKNAAQRYKLGKIAAAEENKMIGAELRSERRRSTELSGKGKAAVAKRTRSTGKALTESLGGDRDDEASVIGLASETGKEVPRLMNGNSEPEVDDPPSPKSAKDDPTPNHQMPKRGLAAADSYPQPLNLARGTDSSNCPEPPGTGCAARPQPSAEDDDGDRAAAIHSSSGSGGDSPHHHQQRPGTASAQRHLRSASTADTGSSGRATSEEVGAESGMQSDSLFGEQRPDPSLASASAGATVMSEADSGEATQGYGKHPDGSISDDTSETSPWKKNVFKRRRPMEEGNTSLTCPVCCEEFADKHHLTMHFREHNTTTTSDGAMHSCKLCGKKLSSTSSLDRHMLIHSGERPHRCPICPMSFTTNGNMRRHVRTHEKGAANGGAAAATNAEGGYITETLYSKPRKRIPSKRLLSPEEPESEFYQSKRPALDSKDSPTKVRVKEEELTCPVCGKTFLCHYGLQTHLELHPNVVIKCDQCEATFKNHRGLRMHVMMSHKKSSPSKASPPPDVPLGFQDLGYVADISCDKFPLIAQEWCEHNVRRCNSIAHRFICSVCSKAFPCSSALDLHKKKNHTIKGDATKPKPVAQNIASPGKDENPPKADVEPAKENKDHYNKLRQTFPSQEEFMATLLLKPNLSPTTNVLPSHPITVVQKMPSTNQVQSSLPVPDSHSHADRDFADVRKILTLTTSASSNPLLMLKHLGKGANQSPVKASSLSSAFTSPSSKSKAHVGVFTAAKPPPAHSHFPGQYKAHVGQADHEPRSADPATEMHFPTEVARDECKMDSVATTGEETASDVGTESEPTEPERTKESSGDEKGSKKVGKYVCKYCQESFLQYSSLKIHLRTHMGLTPFKCLLCDYSSADKSTLVRHMRTHSGERPYSCKMCDFPFTTKANCERHIKKRHGKESKLDIEFNIIHNSPGSTGGDASTSKFRTPDTFCKLCNREFRFFRDLQNHLKVHQRTPSKPFFCLKCQTGFSSKNNCSRHIIKCHPDITKDDVDNYMIVKQMDVPDITQTMANSFASNGEQLSPIDFSKKSPLMMSDSDLSDQSWLSAYTLPNLTDVDAPIDLSLPKDKSSSFLPPVDSSLGRLRFKRVYHKFYSKSMDALVCPHCSQSFKRGSVFKEHIRSHTTERPHRCYYCKAAFTMKESLEKHIERRHSDESKSESPAQSFIPKIATPMQFKLMSRSSQGLRVRISLDNADDDAVNKPDVEPQSPHLQSPGSSFGSDSSGELASVSKILAASSNNFQVCFPQTGGHTKQEGEADKEVHAKDEELSIKEEFQEFEDPTNTVGAAEWDQTEMQDIELAEEYDLVIDESLASSSEAGDGQEVNKTKERSSERDRSNLPTKEMCPYCNRKFPWISSLRRHILTHTGLKPFQCPQCNSSFSTKSNCERHIVRRHCLNVNPGSKVPENPFTCLEGCTDCAYSTKLKLMKHYEIKHIGVPFPECYKNEVKKLPASVIRNALAKRANKLSLSRSFGSSEFRSKVGLTGTTLKLTRHKQFLKRRHSSLEDKPLALVKKNSAATSEDSSRKSHELLSSKKHGVSVKGKPFPVIFKKKKRHKLSLSMLNGSEAHASGRAAGDLLADNGADLVTRGQGNLAGGPGKQATIRSKSKRKHARHCCNQCCKRFKSATTLKRHYRVHTLEHPFRCAECSASFTTKFNCQRHMLKLHGKTKEETQALIEKQRAELPSSGILATKQQKAVGDEELASQQNGQERAADHDSQLESSLVPNDLSNLDVTSSGVKGTVDKPNGETQADKGAESNENPSGDEAQAMEQENGDLDGDDLAGVEGPEMEFDDAILDSDPEASDNGIVDFEATWDQDSGIGPSDDLYHPAETRDCSIISPSGRGRDVFVSGQTDNSDMIQNLLGIQDSSVLDEMLDSADSAAKLLGVE